MGEEPDVVIDSPSYCWLVLLLDVAGQMRAPAVWLARVQMWVAGYTASVGDVGKKYFACEDRFDRAWKQSVTG
jgi:hypothetical protein